MSRPRKKRHHRKRGTGSVFLRRSDQRWLAIPPAWLDPKRRPVVVASEAAGHAYLDELIWRARAGEVQQDGTLGTRLPAWLAANRAKWSKSTRRVYGYLIDRCAPLFGYRPDELTAAILQLWLDGLLAQKLSARYVRSIRSVLGQALGVTLPRTSLPKIPKKAPRAWTARETKRFLAVLVGHRFEAFYLVAIWTGLRGGELRGLKWDDLDLDEALLLVRRTRSDRNEEGPPKSGRERDADLDQSVVWALRSLRARKIDSPYVFANPSRQGRPWSLSTLTSDLRKLCKAAKVPTINLHGTRHTAAVLAIRGGLELPEVAELLGHADSAVTARSYLAAFKRRKRRAVEALASVLRDAK